jgi:hypothetical protein
MDSPIAELTAALAAHAHAYDRSGKWPARCIAAYTAAGAGAVACS